MADEEVGIDEVMQDIVKISGEEVSPTQSASTGEERWHEHLSRLQAMFRSSNMRMNISMWAAGRVYTTLQEEPEYYGLDPEDTPTQKEFGEQYLNRSRETVRRAVKIFQAYDWKWLANHPHIQQTHLLCAMDVPEDKREGVLDEVNEGLGEDMSRREAKDLITSHHPQLEEPEQWPKDADKDEIPESADDYDPNEGVEAMPEPDMTESGAGSDTGTFEAHDVSEASGSIVKAQAAIGRAYQEVRSWVEGMDENYRLTRKEKAAMSTLAETSQSLYNMCQSVEELNT